MFDFIGNIFDLLLTQPIAFVYRLMYNLTGNYGVALILFTIITKFVLLPLNIKSKRGMRAQQALAPKLKEIEKYKQDKQRYQQEMTKIYQQNNISPLGGCLPMLIQFPVFIIIYQIATRPLSYIMRMGKDQVEAVIQWLHERPEIISADIKFLFNQQIPIAETIKSYLTQLQPQFPNLMAIDFRFLGLDLAARPDMSSPSVLWLMPIISGVTSFLVSFIMQKTQAGKGQQPQPQQGGGASKAMTYIMPLFSVWIGFSFPSGVVLYWIVSNIISIAIEPIAGKWIDWKESKKPPPAAEEAKEKKPQLDQIKAREEKLPREKNEDVADNGLIDAEGFVHEDSDADTAKPPAESKAAKPPPVPTVDKYAAYKNRNKKKK